MNYFVGTDIKLFAENDFYPSIRLGAGINLFVKEEERFRLWFEYYQGHLPYSTIDLGILRWWGIGGHLII